MKPTRNIKSITSSVKPSNFIARGRTPATATKFRQGIALNVGLTKNPVEVFCRVRPILDNQETNCIKILDKTTLQISPPETSRQFLTGKENQYSFKEVFPEDSSQKDVFERVTMPLIEDLLHGKNALLFTYGVTGSGKTYTMQGTPEDGGMLIRSIDVIFNSIGDFQATKYVFKPDRLNGFEVQDIVDASLEKANELWTSKRPKLRNNNLSRKPDELKVSNIEEDCGYAVFISYVEIYKSYIYDLLDDGTCERNIKNKFKSKILREDSYRNMYVHGATECEVKSPEEAIEMFHKGQKRRRVAQTILNTESSRSHSVFNIRVVQAPLNSSGSEIITDPNVMTVSQLSLVDLAGSERTSRTNNQGERLKEAGNINNSLMTLRQCIEILRENQMTGSHKMIPYRDAKITHLFKNYFEGNGIIKMIVCVNPKASDYDESINVMMFAEITQEIQIVRANHVKTELGLTPGRRRANQVYQEAFKKICESRGSDMKTISECAPIYNLGPEFPKLCLENSNDLNLIPILCRFLETRITMRNTLLNDFHNRQDGFRKALLNLDNELIKMREENKLLKSQLDSEKSCRKLLESRLVNAEYANNSLQKKVDAFSEMREDLGKELDEKDLFVRQMQYDKERIKQRYKAKISIEKEKLANDFQNKLKKQEIKLKGDSKFKDDKLDALRNIINSNRALPAKQISDSELSQTSSDTPFAPARSHMKMPSITPQPSKASRPAVVNLRHRRSRSTDLWIDHKSANAVPLTTVFQPKMKTRKSVTQLKEKDVIDDKMTKYALTTQDQKSDGEVETKIYKGDVIPTSCGGRQVVLNDLEILTQTSPVKEEQTTRHAKRSFEEFSASVGSKIKDLESRCNVGIEGGRTRASKRLCK